MATGPSDPSLLVDLQRYPLLSPESEPYRACVEEARRQLAANGAAEIPGFVSPAGVAELVRDADALAERAHRSGGQGTAYLEFPDFTLPPEHPRLHFADYAVRAVAYDITPLDSPLRLLYEWDPLKDLIDAVLERGPIFRYADPFGALEPGRDGRGRPAAVALRPDRLRRLARHPVGGRRRGLRGGAAASGTSTTSATPRWRPCWPATAPGSRHCR